jgi:hypothetical protein
MGRAVSGIVLMLIMTVPMALADDWWKETDREALLAGLKEWSEKGGPERLNEIRDAVAADVLRDLDYNFLPSYFNRNFRSQAFLEALKTVQASDNANAVIIVTGGLTDALQGWREWRSAQDGESSKRLALVAMGTMFSNWFDRLGGEAFIAADLADRDALLLRVALNERSAYQRAAVEVITNNRTLRDALVPKLLAARPQLPIDARVELAIQLLRFGSDYSLTAEQETLLLGDLVEAMTHQDFEDWEKSPRLFWLRHQERSVPRFFTRTIARTWTELETTPKAERPDRLARVLPAIRQALATAIKQPDDAWRTAVFTDALFKGSGGEDAWAPYGALLTRELPVAYEWGLASRDPQTLAVVVDCGAAMRSAACLAQARKIADDPAIADHVLAAVAKGLRSAGQAEDWPRFRRWARHPTPEVATVAIMALATAKQKEDLPLLMDLAEKHSDRDLIELVMVAIRADATVPLEWYARMMYHADGHRAHRAFEAVAERTRLSVTGVSGHHPPQRRAALDHLVGMLKKEGFVSPAFVSPPP